MPDADGLSAVIVSYPKSGRTWLRFMLANILSDRPVRTLHDSTAVIPNVEHRRGADRIVVAHDPLWLSHAERGVVLLRDPGEILVSFYFHATEHRTADRFKGSVEEFIESGLGIPPLAEFFTSLAEHTIEAGSEPTVITYDDLVNDPAASLSTVLAALDCDDSNGRDDGDAHRSAGVIDAVVARSTLDAMRHVEAARPLNDRFDLDHPKRNRIRAGLADRGQTLLSLDDRARIAAGLQARAAESLDRLRPWIPDDWCV